MKTLCFALLFAAVACSKQEPPAPAAAASAAPVVASAVPSAEAPMPVASAATDDAAPIEEDFEDEATQTVTATTLDSQLDALEKEIQSD